MKTITRIVIALLIAVSVANADAQITQQKSFQKSYALEKAKDYGSAITVLKEVYDKSSYEINLRLGWLYYKTEDYNESVTYYQAAANLQPQALEAKNGLTYPLSLLDIEKLMELYKKILEVDPMDMNANYQLGYYYYNKSNLPQAKIYFEKVIALYPSGYDQYLRETWRDVSGQPAPPEKVVAAFTKSYRLEYAKDYAGAVATLMEVYDPTYYDVNLRLGWLNYLNGMFMESMRYYKIAIELKPASIEPRIGINYALASLGNNDEVISQNKKILEVNPQNTFSNYAVGMYYYNKGDYGSALPYFEKIVTLYPFTYDGLVKYAWTNLKLGKMNEAKALFDRVITLSPGDKSALEGLSMIR